MTEPSLALDPAAGAPSPSRGNSRANPPRVCFSCHREGHVSRDCPSWAGRCFRCGAVGHKGSECSRVRSSSPLPFRSPSSHGLSPSISRSLARPSFAEVCATTQRPLQLSTSVATIVSIAPSSVTQVFQLFSRAPSAQWQSVALSLPPFVGSDATASEVDPVKADPHPSPVPADPDNDDDVLVDSSEVDDECDVEFTEEFAREIFDELSFRAAPSLVEIIAAVCDRVAEVMAAVRDDFDHTFETATRALSACDLTLSSTPFVGLKVTCGTPLADRSHDLRDIMTFLKHF